MRKAQTLVEARDLGRARSGVDLALGTGAIAPVVALAALGLVGDAESRSLARDLSVVWSGALLAFFAGVRRGLSFAEAGGGKIPEILTLLTLFGLGALTLLLHSPTLGAIGCACVGAFDALAARRAQAPAYFKIFRPLQMAVAIAALAIIAWVCR